MYNCLLSVDFKSASHRFLWANNNNVLNSTFKINLELDRNRPNHFFTKWLRSNSWSISHLAGICPSLFFVSCCISHTKEDVPNEKKLRSRNSHRLSRALDILPDILPLYCLIIRESHCFVYESPSIWRPFFPYCTQRKEREIRIIYVSKRTKDPKCSREIHVTRDSARLFILSTPDAH